MKRKLLLPVLALTAFLGTLLSCSSDSGTASIQIPVTQIFRNVEKDILPSDTNKIKLEITLSGDAKKRRIFDWEEKEQNCTFENLPVGGVVSVSAKVKDGEDLIYSGESDKIKLKNEQNETTITMKKHRARLTVKIDSNEIPALQESLVEILITVTDGKDTWETTPQDFSGGHEIKYLPINKELTVTAEAKTKDTTDTAIFRGSSKITIAEKDQNPECTIKMERVNGDTSVEIQTLPTPELKAIYTNGNTTFSLKQDTALFTIYYTDSSNPDINQQLPNWVTYKWKMNDTEFTPNDASGQATFGKNEEGKLILTIYLNKMESIIPLGANNNTSQNRLYVEIGMENSEETKSTGIEFKITQ